MNACGICIEIFERRPTLACHIKREVRLFDCSPPFKNSSLEIEFTRRILYADSGIACEDKSQSNYLYYRDRKAFLQPLCRKFDLILRFRSRCDHGDQVRPKLVRYCLTQIIDRARFLGKCKLLRNSSPRT